MVVEEVIDELYSFDNNQWYIGLENIFKILHFPVKMQFVSEWEEFIYVHSNRLRYLSIDDRKVLSDCLGIAAFSIRGRFRRIKAFGIKISGNKRLRNDKAAEIYKLFRKLYGRYIFFAVCFDDEIVFIGTSFDKRKGNETIISDWFGYNTDREVLDRVEEIDFLNYSDASVGQLYSDYVWAIARPYIKYRESKMFLIFGCGYIETYDSFVQTPDGKRMLVTKVDREETLRVNSSFYPDLYGDDYFIDDSGQPDDSLDILDENDAEFEWAMLEMDLAEEKNENDFENLDYEDEPEVEEYDSYESELSEMNPEEMLKYIREK